MTTTDKLPEHYEQAEWFLLACLIEKPEILPSIEPDLFYLEACRQVLRTVIALKDAGMEIIWPNVGMKLHRDGQPEVFRLISTALDQLPSPAGWSYWLDICQEFRAARQTAALAVEMSEAATLAGTGLRPDLTALGGRLREIASGASQRGPNSAATILNKVIDNLETAWTNPESLFGIRTPFHELDRLTSGLQRGSLNVFAARPGVGKSAFAGNLAAFAAFGGHPVAFFSLEMSAELIMERMLAVESRVPLAKFRHQAATEADFHAMSAARVKLGKAPLLIYDTTTDIADICREASAAVQYRGAKLIIVDYLQKVEMRSCRDGHFAKVGAISGSLKTLAMELKIPVVALAQLSREVEKDRRKPVLSDLKDSGSIEQDADVIGFLYLEKESTGVEVSLSISKNRNGPIGMVRLVFDKTITRFESEKPAPEGPEI